MIVLIDFQMLNQSSWCNPLLVSNIFDMLWNSILFRIFFLHSLVALFYSFHFLSCLLEQGSCSDTKCCPTLCDPMDCSTPGSSVLHRRPEFAQTHVCWVSDAYLTISSSVTPFSSCLHSFPASGCFQMSQFFGIGGQSIGVSASASEHPMNFSIDFL